MNVIGDKFYSAADVHIFLRKLNAYILSIFKHGNQLPSWKQLQNEEIVNYEKNIHISANTKMMIPIISIIELCFSIKNKSVHQIEIQAILINILVLYGLYLWSMPLLMLVGLAAFWSYYQSKNQKDVSIPFIGEISEILEKIIEWKREKSVSQKVTFTSNNK